MYLSRVSSVLPVRQEMSKFKANAVQTFKSRSQGAETEMVFRVV